jgi:hypothetical protein
MQPPKKKMKSYKGPRQLVTKEELKNIKGFKFPEDKDPNSFMNRVLAKRQNNQ